MTSVVNAVDDELKQVQFRDFVRDRRRRLTDKGFSAIFSRLDRCFEGHDDTSLVADLLQVYTN